MLDIKYIKENPEEVIARACQEGQGCARGDRGDSEAGRGAPALIAGNEAMKAEANKTNKLIPQYKREGKDVAALFAEMKELSAKTKANDEKVKEVEERYTALMLGLPNLPDEDLLPGGKENNQPLRYWGEPRTFDFEPKNHVDLCTDLGLIDYPRGTKLAGSGFWIYRGMGARLEWALLNYFMDTHLADGYEMILPPAYAGVRVRTDGGAVPEVCRRGVQD